MRNRKNNQHIKWQIRQTVQDLGSFLVFRGDRRGSESQAGGWREEEWGQGGVGNSNWAPASRWPAQTGQQVKQKSQEMPAENLKGAVFLLRAFYTQSSNTNGSQKRYNKWSKKKSQKHLNHVNQDLADGAAVWRRPVKTPAHTNLYSELQVWLHDTYPRIPFNAPLEGLPTVTPVWCQRAAPPH